MRILFFALIFASGISFAAVENQSAIEAASVNIQNTVLTKGMYEVGGSFGLGYGSTSGSSMYISPRVEYFFTVQFAAGGSTSIFTSKDSTNYGLGPSLSYYFWKNSNAAAYAGAGAIFHKNTYSYGKDDEYWSNEASLGMKYFLTSSVTFGPELRYLQNVGIYQSSAIDLNFQFSIFL